MADGFRLSLAAHSVGLLKLSDTSFVTLGPKGKDRFNPGTGGLAPLRIENRASGLLVP